MPFATSSFQPIRAFLANPPGRSVACSVFMGLAIIDTAFVVGHGAALSLVLLGHLADVPGYLSIYPDDSPSERFNHLKWLLIVGIMALLAHRTHAPVFTALAIVFSVILADDALGLHERGGILLRQLWPGFPQFGGSTHQAAELVIWALLGLALLPIGLWGYASASPPFRRSAIWMGIGFSCAVLSGVGLDTLGEAARLFDGDLSRRIAKTLARLTECYAESLSASLTLSLAAGLVSEPTSPLPKAQDQP